MARRPGSLWHFLEVGAKLSALETVAAYFLPVFLLLSPLSGLVLQHAPQQLGLFLVMVQIPCLLTGRMSYVDLGWPLGLVLLGAFALTAAEGYYLRRRIIGAIVLLHGGRMALGASAMFFPYTFPNGDLPRYQYARKRWESICGMPPSWWWVKQQQDVLQQCFANVVVLACPVLLVASDRTQALGAWECAGFLGWAVFWCLESTADLQKFGFERRVGREKGTDGSKKGSVPVLGLTPPYNGAEFFLWTLCRHPNYFCEWMCWVSICLAALPALGHLDVPSVVGLDFAGATGLVPVGVPSGLEPAARLPVSIPGAVIKAGLGAVLCFLPRFFYDCLLHWTGAAPAEFFSLRKRPEYADYQAATRCFWPLEVPWVDHFRTRGWPGEAD